MRHSLVDPKRWQAAAKRHRRPSGSPPVAASGQALAEFAIVVPVLIALLGGIIQFGLIFWTQNTLTQVVRDTGRWAATQQSCSLYNATSNTSGVNIANQANLVAGNASLLGYTTGEWTATSESSDTGVAAFSSEGVAVAWVKESDPANEGCPPTDNASVYHVTIKINHVVPIFLPGLQYLPGIGQCDNTGCHIMLSSTAQYRMEPAP